MVYNNLPSTAVQAVITQQSTEPWQTDEMLIMIVAEGTEYSANYQK
jgi:hypothetical protein